MSHLFSTRVIEGLGRSHACDLEWAAGSGVLISSRSQLWGQPHTPQAGWRRALAPLGSSSGCCSFCPHPPCSSPGAVLVGTAMQRDDPCWRDSELWHQCLAPDQGECLAQAQNVPWQDPGAASLLNIDGYCLHGGLGAPALQIVFPCAEPDRVPRHSQQSSWAGYGAQQVGECQPGAVPRALICWCVALFKDPGEEKQEVLGLLE